MNTGSWQPDPKWTAPTAPAPVVGTGAPRSRNQLWAVLIGVAALVAAGVFAVVSLQDDDPSTTPATVVATTSTSVPATTTTAPATTTSSPTTTPTTVAPVIDAATLIATMPADAEVPADWSRYHEPEQLTDVTGAGLCRGPNEVARAIQSGSTAVVAGPIWDLPNDGWFGVEMMMFVTESDASAFILATAAQANTCTASPAVWERSEADVDLFGGDFGGDAIWQQSEVVSASDETTVNGDQDLRVLQERRSVTTYDVTYSQVERWIYSYERHGRFVIEFWIGGEWGETGWSSFTGAYQPTDADLDSAADVVRAGIVARLAEAGAL